MAIGGGMVSDLYPSGLRSRPGMVLRWTNGGTCTRSSPRRSHYRGPWMEVGILDSVDTGTFFIEITFFAAKRILEAGICATSLYFLLVETHQATLFRRAKIATRVHATGGGEVGCPNHQT